MAKKIKGKSTYYKLNDKATMFYCPVSRLKVVKSKPGMLKGKPSKKVEVGTAKGHIISISKEEYETMMEAHNKGIDKAVKASQAKAAKKATVLVVSEPAKEEASKEEVEEEDEEEEKKPLNKMNKDDLELEVMGLDEITEEKVAEVMEGTKKEVVKFIEKYDAETDSDVESEDEDEDEEEDDN